MKKTLVIVLVVALLSGGMAVAAQSGYSISVSGSTTDVPSTTISFGGNSHTITEVAVRDEGGSVTVDATAPEGETYDVNLYNSDGDVVDSERYRGGSSSTRFSLGSPGTYGAAVYEGEVKDLAGIVVAGYDVDLTVPSSAEQGETVEATVELTDVGGGSIERVEVVLIGSENIRTTATKESGSTYTATISLEDARSGGYDAYGVVFSPDEFDNGQNEIIGLSSGQSFTVEESSDNSGDDDSDSPSSPGAEDPTPTPTDDSAVDTDTPTDTGDSDPTPTDTDADDTPTDTDADDTPTDTDADDTPTEATTDTDEPTTDTTATDGDGTGLGVLIAVVALVATIAALGRRR